MKIVMPGGTGQVGMVLERAFTAAGHEVVVLSRGAGAGPGSSRAVAWDARTLGPWAAELDGADVVVNLAGRTVNARYGARVRREIMDSRVDSTRVLGEAIAQAARPPRVWLQSSTATIYAHGFDHAHDERSGVLGGDEPHAPAMWRFSIDVAKAWERACTDAPTPDTRKVLMRSAMVLSPDRGGVFDVLLGLVRRGLGGRAGSGRQYLSWIHHEDFTRATELLIEREDLEGPVNLAAPHPVPHAEFMRVLRDAWGIRFGLPAEQWMLELGAVAVRTETELVLKSLRVVPGRLLDAGFAFRFPDWPRAASDLVAAWRAEEVRA